MATLRSSIFGEDAKELTDMEHDELVDWIEKLRSKRQLFTDSAYETRTTKRAKSAKRKGPEITAEFLAELDDLDF